MGKYNFNASVVSVIIFQNMHHKNRSFQNKRKRFIHALITYKNKFSYLMHYENYKKMTMNKLILSNNLLSY